MYIAIRNFRCDGKLYIKGKAVPKNVALAAGNKLVEEKISIRKTSPAKKKAIKKSSNKQVKEAPNKSMK